MTSQEITLVLKQREQVRKGLKRLRQSGQLPAVIHNPGQPSIIVSGNYADMLKAFQQAGKHHPINLSVDGKTYLTIIKNVDFDNLRHNLRHVVFGIIKQTEKVETDIPIVLTGEDAPALKAGLLIIRQLDHLHIEALPRDLPDEVTIAQTNLVKVGDRITVGDIKAPDKVTILTEPERTVVIVEEPKAVESAETELAKAATDEANVTAANDKTDTAGQ